jgi:microcystin-dependent protein
VPAVAPPDSSPPPPAPPIPVTPSPVETTPVGGDLAPTLQSIADRLSALEKTGSFAPGMIAWTAGPDAPPGWLIADGRAFDVNLYSALHIICPTGFLPNLVDRIPIGAGTTYPLLSIGGAATLAISAANLPAHTHTTPSATSGSTAPGVGSQPTGNVSGGQSSDHAHGPYAATSGAYFVDPGAYYGLSTAAVMGGVTSGHTHTIGHTHTSAAHTHTIPAGTTGSTGSGTAISTLSPYIALTPLIHI